MDKSSAIAILAVVGFAVAGFGFYCLIDFLIKSRRP